MLHVANEIVIYEIFICEAIRLCVIDSQNLPTLTLNSW